MPHVGQLVVDSVVGKVDFTNIQNVPKFATQSQVAAMGSANNTTSKPLTSAQGNLDPKANVVNIMKEVTAALDDLKVPTKTPASSRDKGYTGMVCHDNQHIYVCVGTNSWRRAKLEPF